MAAQIIVGHWVVNFSDVQKMAGLAGVSSLFLTSLRCMTEDQARTIRLGMSTPALGTVGNEIYSLKIEVAKIMFAHSDAFRSGNGNFADM